MRTPDQQALKLEEQRVLWQALEEIPETYRVPLVLYYREGRSVRTVADMLGLSQDAVKRRLSRGRRMLKAQVAAFVEGALARTRPRKSFAIAVLASLPSAAPKAAAAATRR